MRIRTLASAQLFVLSGLGCSQNGGVTNQTTGGFANATGGSSLNSTAPTGGQATTGGSSAIGASTAALGGNQASTGGTSAASGGAATGGRSASASTSSAAGGTPTGGFASTGGVSSSAGGISSTGGSKAVGGTNGTGGTANTGGTGNTGGSAAAGGTSGVGGTSAAGGVAPTGGSSSAGGSTNAYFGFKPVPSSQNTTNFDAKAWYTQWLNGLYADCSGTSQGRIANGNGSNNTVSEGIGYGMLMAVGNDDQSHFDKLWAYYKAHEDTNGLMNWSIDGCTAGNNNAYAATDADEDAAMALVQADAKWGGYKTDATTLINAIKKYETAAGPPTYLRPGDAANNGGKGDGTVNPSYFATGYWHVWATYVSDPFWNQLATDTYTMLANFQALTVNDATNTSTTGSLVPDWGMSPGTNPNNNKYWYDACRTPWRVAVDYAWFGNTQSQTFLQNVCKYIDAKGFSTIISSYNSNGAGNSAFFGAFALAGMAVSQAKADEYLNSWLSAQMDDTPYFQGALRGVYLLLANQNFPKGI